LEIPDWHSVENSISNEERGEDTCFLTSHSTVTFLSFKRGCTDMKLKETGILLLLSIAVLSGGCATSPKEKFAGFYDRPQHERDAKVLFDTLIFSDIKGKDVGINKKKNEEARGLVEKAVIDELTKRNYVVDTIYHGSGLSFEKTEGKNYVYSEEWQSTGEDFKGPDAQKEKDLWVSDEGRNFVRQLISRGRQLSEVDKNKTETKAIKITVPEFIDTLPSDQLIFVHVTGGEIGMGKSVGLGVLTGAISLAASGGTMMYSSTSKSGSAIDIVVFDKQAGDVVWHNHVPQGQRYKYIAQSMDVAFKDFPMVDGTIYKSEVAAVE